MILPPKTGMFQSGITLAVISACAFCNCSALPVSVICVSCECGPCSGCGGRSLALWLPVLVGRAPYRQFESALLISVQIDMRDDKHHKPALQRNTCTNMLSTGKVRATIRCLTCLSALILAPARPISTPATSSSRAMRSYDTKQRCQHEDMLPITQPMRHDTDRDCAVRRDV